MRTIEVRRHSLRGAGAGLSAAGRELACAVCATMMAHYDLVLTSEKPRARETAEAMGFTVDAQDEAFGVFDADQLGDYAAAFSAAPGREMLLAFARRYTDALRTYLPRTPDGGRTLLISHGGSME